MTPVPASGGTSVGAYTKGKFLSKGAFGQAFLAKCKGSHKEFVIKMVDISCCDHKERESARKECTILSRLKHPNIIEYRESFEEKGQLCIVMAYADGGDLSARLKAQGGKLLNEDQIADWFVQICLALKHLHDRKILHRDLKSQNIFLTGRKQMIKLGDFGIARVLKHTNEHARTAIGTPYYLSPEICEGKPYNNKSDVWSLGIVLYELCTLKCPFDANNLNGLILKIIRGVYAPVPANLSQPLRSLVSLLLTRVPCSRPNINELLRMRYIKDRIGFFLDESLRKEEFSHTVLHSSTSQPAASAPAPDVASKRPSPSQGVQPIHKPVEPAKPAHHAAAKDPLPKTPAPKTGRREAPAPAAAPRKHGGMLKDAKHPSVVKADAKAVSKTASDAEAASAIWSKLVGGEGDNGGRAERPALGVGMGGKNRPRVGLLEKMVKDRERERVERVQREMEREREATQQRMNRGANAVGRLQGRGDLKGEVMFLEQKKREEAHARAAAAREKRELMRQDMIRMRDLYRCRLYPKPHTPYPEP
jgi:NIMA (never in mitosis gene a)-related kinase